MLTCYLLIYTFTYLRTPKGFPHTQPPAGQIILIIHQLKQSKYVSVLGVSCCRDVKERKNSICVQLRILVTCMPFSEICVLLSPGSSVSRLGTLKDAIITYGFNYILLLTAQ